MSSNGTIKQIDHKVILISLCWAKEQGLVSGGTSEILHGDYYFYKFISCNLAFEPEQRLWWYISIYQYKYICSPGIDYPKNYKKDTGKSDGFDNVYYLANIVITNLKTYICSNESSMPWLFCRECTRFPISTHIAVCDLFALHIRPDLQSPNVHSNLCVFVRCMFGHTGVCKCHPISRYGRKPDASGLIRRVIRSNHKHGTAY